LLIDFEPINTYIWLMKYNWQQEWWPRFSFDKEALEEKLDQFLQNEGYISGVKTSLKTNEAEEFLIENLIQEAIHTFSIEGEYLSREDLRSSILNQLGVGKNIQQIKDMRSRGIVALMIKNRNTFKDILNAQSLFDWHNILMEPYLNLNIGQWRKSKEDMKIVSGTYLKEEVHFVAPKSSQINIEMQQFFDWINQNIFCKKPNPRQAPVLAAIAHIYFESIHPFEDGNGRIGRAISEKILAYNLGYPCLYSLSKSIHDSLENYYQGLKENQRRQDITSWIDYFIEACLHAQDAMKRNILHTIEKTKFFDLFKSKLNARQQKVLNKMWEAGPAGFEGGMSAKKYISIAKTSKATATRDLQELVQFGAFVPEGEGRSRRYRLVKGTGTD